MKEKIEDKKWQKIENGIENKKKYENRRQIKY